MASYIDFYEKLKEDREHSRFNSVSMDEDKYMQLIKKVIMVKQKKKKDGNEYKFLKRYDILEEDDGTIRLVSPTKDTNSTKYFVHDEQLFHVLNDAHVSTQHGGRDKMMKILRGKYQNITYKDVQIFLNSCRSCQEKQKSTNMLHPMPLYNELHSRCQINFIDFQTKPDGQFNYILIYQDYLTKFIVLKPLITKSLEEISKIIIEIFTLFGAPSILHSENSKELVKILMCKLKYFWPKFKIIYGSVDNCKTTEGTVNNIKEEVENMIINWMNINETDRWSEGLKFVQLIKNSSLDNAIKKSPYEAMFGCFLKPGLGCASIPTENLQLIHSEEDLEKLIGIANPKMEEEDSSS